MGGRRLMMAELGAGWRRVIHGGQSSLGAGLNTIACPEWSGTG